MIRYPVVNWKQAKGLRDIIAHNYFQLDGAVILDTVRSDMPVMYNTIIQIINDIQNEKS